MITYYVIAVKPIEGPWEDKQFEVLRHFSTKQNAEDYIKKEEETEYTGMFQGVDSKWYLEVQEKDDEYDN